MTPVRLEQASGIGLCLRGGASASLRAGSVGLGATTVRCPGHISAYVVPLTRSCQCPIGYGSVNSDLLLLDICTNFGPHQTRLRR